MEPNRRKRQVVSADTAATTAWPVSYTHLDVYKRQDIDLDVVREVKATWKFDEHRRPETYGALTR